MKEINPLRKRNTVNEGQCIYKDTNNSLFKKIQKKFYSQFPLSILQTLPYFWFNLTKYALNDTQKKNLLEKKCIISIMDTIGESCVEVFKI